ncbi:hypothetical protein PFMALIP_01732, partial [Plasmodium falciparum MaliPS096_E11]
YHKQQCIYQGEHEKLPNNSNGGDNNCCTEIKKHSTTAEDFLKSLKHCKNNQNSENKENELNFSKPLQTFSRSTYCKTCPPNKVNCNSAGRAKNGCTPVNGNGNKWQSVFNEMSGNSGNSTTIDVHIIDRIRKQNWTCKFNKDKNMDVCKLDKFDQEIDLNEYTTFKVFLQYWIQDFIEGYYILKKKKKIDLCTQKEGKTCEEDSKNDCACVKKWVEQKSTQWGKIQERFNEQYNYSDPEVRSSVRGFLVDLIRQIAVTIDKGHHTHLEKLVKSLKCNCTDNSEKEGDKDANKKDIVQCLIDKLQKEIKTCPGKPSGNETETECQKPPLVEDDDEPFEEENPVTQPNICPKVETTEEEKTDDKCGEIEEKKDEKKEQPEQTAKEDVGPAPGPEDDTEEKAPVPRTPALPNPPPQLLDNPHVLTALVTSTLAWSVGIGFA